MARISTCNIDDAEIIRQKQTIPEDGLYYCSFCGKKTPRGSFWSGPHQTIVLCTACLEDGYVMGALIGDAIIDNRTHLGKEIMLKMTGGEILGDVDRYIMQVSRGAYRTIIIQLQGMINKTQKRR